MARGEARAHRSHGAAGDRIKAASELVASAALSASAERAAADTLPAMEEAGVWLYGEMLPQGRLTAEQGAVLMQAVALTHCNEPPEALVRTALEQAQGLLGAGAAAG